MGSFVTLSPGFWDEKAGWPKDAKLLYLWSWTNSHVHGVSGIGRTSDAIVQVETGLSAEELDRARVFLVELDKVRWRGQWFLVMERIDHTCRTRAGTWNLKLVENVRRFLNDNDLPAWVVAALQERYPDMLRDGEWERLLSMAKVREGQQPRTNGAGG